MYTWLMLIIQLICIRDCAKNFYMDYLMQSPTISNSRCLDHPYCSVAEPDSETQRDSLKHTK